jgi:hypothetical protein
MSASKSQAEIDFENASDEDIINPKGATRPRAGQEELPFGMNADGTLNIVPKEAIERAIAWPGATRPRRWSKPAGRETRNLTGLARIIRTSGSPDGRCHPGKALARRAPPRGPQPECQA